MKKIISFTAAFFIMQICNGQDIKSKLCGKKWYPVKIKDVDGTIDKVDTETAKLFSILNCDGTFESWESPENLIKGKWTYDTKNKSVILMTSDITHRLKVINCNGTSFDYITKDGGGENITIFSIAK